MAASANTLVLIVQKKLNDVNASHEFSHRNHFLSRDVKSSNKRVHTDKRQIAVSQIGQSTSG